MSLDIKRLRELHVRYLNVQDSQLAQARVLVSEAALDALPDLLAVCEAACAWRDAEVSYRLLDDGDIRQSALDHRARCLERLRAVIDSARKEPRP